MNRLLAIVVPLMLLAGCAAARSSTSNTATSAHRVLQGDPGEVVVMVFASPDCPISNALAPEYQRLQAQTEEGGGRFYLVHARSDVTAKVASDHAADYRLTMPIVLDSEHVLVEKMNATVTPEAVVLVFDEGDTWRKAYQGKINDLYASLGNRRDHPTQFWLRDAIDTSMEGGEVEVTYRKPLGCYIERRR